MSYKPLQDGSGADSKEEENENLAADQLLGEEEGTTTLPAAVAINNHAHGNISFIASPHPCYKVVRYTLAVGAFVLLFSFLAAAITLVILAPACSVAPIDGQVWWKTTVIYQCYPRSFKDSNGDGNGDLVGIRNSLNYLHDVGINAVWLNPIFKSPQKDNGYDISNYTDIDPLYGTIEELGALLKELHSKGMHLILDFVPNHTSDQHPWFKESRKSIDNPKRDWYVWANASSDGGPPNNWFSLFGGSAWTFDNTTNQYYLHQFSAFQPDLNYHNPQVRKAMEDIIKFWFEFGVDGFRIDAVIYLLEDPELRSEPANPDFNETVDCSVGSNASDCYNSLIHNETSNYAGIHDIIKSWRKISDSYDDKFLVGETYDPVETVMTYYGEDNDEFHFPFNFLLLSNTNWTGDGVNDSVSEWMDALPDGAWPNWVLGNHDNARIANKVGNYLARAINVLLLTLPGTPTTYYGEELLMTDVLVPPDKQHDLGQGRDKERTPMQWNTGPNAGFTKSGVEPWLPVATNYTEYNVQSESRNSTSMLNLYKKVVSLVTMKEAFRFANYTALLSNKELFAYHRFLNGSNDEFIVVINFSRSNAVANLSTVEDMFYNPVFELSSADSIREGSKVDLSEVSMVGGEAVIIRGRNKDDLNYDC